jgi:hypothetical protein
VIQKSIFTEKPKIVGSFPSVFSLIDLLQIHFQTMESRAGICTTVFYLIPRRKTPRIAFPLTILSKLHRVMNILSSIHSPSPSHMSQIQSNVIEKVLRHQKVFLVFSGTF